MASVFNEPFNRFPIVKMDNGLTLKGFSWAGLASHFWVSELGLSLDFSLRFNETPHMICITHGHADHISNLSNAFWEMGKHRPQILVPEPILNDVEKLLEAHFNLSQGFKKMRAKIDIIPMGFKGKKEFCINIKGRYIKVIPIYCRHSVPCLGYGFFEMRKKLKAEYIGEDGRTLEELKKSGEIIHDEIEIPLFCHLGDTDKTILKEEGKKLVLFPQINIECTFIKDSKEKNDAMKFAKKTKHMAWAGLEEFISTHKKIKFVLFHVSSKYSIDEIHDFFDIQCTKYSNVIPFIQKKGKCKQITSQRTIGIGTDSELTNKDVIIHSTRNTSTQPKSHDKFIPKSPNKFIPKSHGKFIPKSPDNISLKSPDETIISKTPNKISLKKSVISQVSLVEAPDIMRKMDKIIDLLNTLACSKD